MKLRDVSTAVLAAALVVCGAGTASAQAAVASLCRVVRDDVLPWFDGMPGLAAWIVEYIADPNNPVPTQAEDLIYQQWADGLAERMRPVQRRPGRPPLLFRAVRRMDPGGPRRYELLAQILTAGLTHEPNAGATAQAAGRAWASKLVQPAKAAPGAQESIGELVGLLTRLGFSPDPPASAERGYHIGLRHCPFLEVAEKASSVICPIHLGLMQGALAIWGAPITVDRLDPFVEPDLCLAHLSSTTAA